MLSICTFHAFLKTPTLIVRIRGKSLGISVLRSNSMPNIYCLFAFQHPELSMNPTIESCNLKIISLFMRFFPGSDLRVESHVFDGILQKIPSDAMYSRSPPNCLISRLQNILDSWIN